MKKPVQERVGGRRGCVGHSTGALESAGRAGRLSEGRKDGWIRKLLGAMRADRRELTARRGSRSYIPGQGQREQAVKPVGRSPTGGPYRRDFLAPLGRKP